MTALTMPARPEEDTSLRPVLLAFVVAAAAEALSLLISWYYQPSTPGSPSRPVPSCASTT